MMKHVLVSAFLLLLVACGGGKSTPTAPTTPVTPTPSVWTLSGTVTSSATGAPIGSVTVRATDAAGATKASTVTDASGRYTLANLAQGGYTVVFSAPNYFGTSDGVNLIANATLDIRLAPTPLFSRSGTGANVFDMPTTVSRIRIQATYAGSCENFIVHIAGRGVVNEILGTCSVAIGRNFDGTFVTAGGVVEVLFSSNIAWTFTEVR